jgi:hypothetical protein
MSHIWVGSYEITQDEYEQRVAERKKASQPANRR